MNCKNCATPVSSNYCSHCGQNSKVSKITFSKLVNEIVENIIQIDKGFLYTAKELFQRPGKAILEYLRGQRVNHLKPITYLLVLSTMYFLISSFTNENTWINDLMIGFNNGAMHEDSESETPKVFGWFANNYAYTSLLLLPVFSLATYLCFTKLGKNFLEHIVINSYISGQQAIIYSIFALINSKVDHDILEFLPFLTAFIYCLWAYLQLYENRKSIVIVLFLLITSYILYLIMSFGLMLMLMLIQNIM